MPLVFHEFTLIGVTVLHHEFAVRAPLAIDKNSLVAVSIREYHHSGPVLHSLFVFALETNSRRLLLGPMAVRDTVKEGAFVDLSICFRVLSLALFGAFDESSLVDVSELVPLNTHAVRDVVLPLALILSATDHRHLSLTVSLSFAEVSFIRVSRCEDKFAFPVGHTVLHFTSVNVPRRSLYFSHSPIFFNLQHS